MGRRRTSVPAAPIVFSRPVMVPEVKPLVDAYQYEEAAEQVHGKLGRRSTRGS